MYLRGFMVNKTNSRSFDSLLEEVLALNEKCSKMTVSDIKAGLKSRNLKTSGRKTFIVKRLVQAKILELFGNKTNKEGNYRLW